MVSVHPCLFLLLLVPIISTARTTLDAAVPLASLADLPSFVFYQFGRNFSDQQKKCIEDGPDKCRWYYSVGTGEPCQKGELYLYYRTEALRTKGLFEPVCQQPSCPLGYSLLLADKNCYHDYVIETVCSGGLKPGRNLFGETFCRCDFSEATLLGSKKKECHTLFTQGPCARGSLFVPVNDLTNFGQGHCLPSPCAKLLNGNKTIAEIRMPNGGAECFELGTQGPCRNNYTLNIVDHALFPGVQRLSCWEKFTYEFAIGTQPVATSEECVPNNKGVCVPHVPKEEIQLPRLYVCMSRNPEACKRLVN